MGEVPRAAIHRRAFVSFGLIERRGQDGFIAGLPAFRRCEMAGVRGLQSVQDPEKLVDGSPDIHRIVDQGADIAFRMGLSKEPALRRRILELRLRK